MNHTRVNLARALAMYAHDGQKYGPHDYYEYHVLGVASSFEYGSDEYIVALLHDVVEDGDVTTSTIYELFGPIAGNSVIDLTHYGDQSYKEYIEIIKHNEAASSVKIADLRFNLSQPEAKQRAKYNAYVEALAILEES